MSELRSALDSLLTVDDRALSDEQLVDDLDEVERANRQLDVIRARRVAEIERRGTFAVEGHLSVASWLAVRHRVSHGVAAGHVRVARALEKMPVTAQALSSGDVSTSAVMLLAHTRDAAPEQFARAEETLVDAARTQPVEELKSTVTRWRQEHADDDPDDISQELYVSPTLRGRGKVTGDLNAETTQVMITALRAVEDAETRSSDRTDVRSPARRRADALGEICRQWLDSTNRPTVAGERPHVIVTVDVETLERSGGERRELPDVGSISADDARLWACDCRITRVITDASSRPLDVGRTTKVVPPWLRRALLVRDRGCAFPHCGRPPSWCDAHHVQHWASGGTTALSNLVLLCRRHHRLIHHRRFGVRIVEDLPRFYRSDGTVIDTVNRAPP